VGSWGGWGFCCGWGGGEVGMNYVFLFRSENCFRTTQELETTSSHDMLADSILKTGSLKH
jgi:hypothetical protein